MVRATITVDFDPNWYGDSKDDYTDEELKDLVLDMVFHQADWPWDSDRDDALKAISIQR